MKFDINFNQSSGYVYIQTGGEASVRGFEELLAGLVGSPDWIIGTPLLIDHRNLILDKFPSGDMENIKDAVHKNLKKLGKCRCAFVISDTLGYGLARMYDLLGGRKLHNQSDVFYSIEEAVEWLKKRPAAPTHRAGKIMPSDVSIAGNCPVKAPSVKSWEHRAILAQRRQTQRRAKPNVVSCAEGSKAK